jgi:hypothetical protein
MATWVSGTVLWHRRLPTCMLRHVLLHCGMLVHCAAAAADLMIRHEGESAAQQSDPTRTHVFSVIA